jgi:hypothetical protein
MAFCLITLGSFFAFAWRNQTGWRWGDFHPRRECPGLTGREGCSCLSASWSDSCWIININITIQIRKDSLVSKLLKIHKVYICYEWFVNLVPYFFSLNILTGLYCKIVKLSNKISFEIFLFSPKLVNGNSHPCRLSQSKDLARARAADGRLVSSL